MSSKQKQILIALEAALQPLIVSGSLRSTNRGNIRLDFSDFLPDELPVVQLIAGATVVISQQGKLMNRAFNVAIELIIRQEHEAKTVNQDLFLDLAYEVERALLDAFPYVSGLNITNVLPQTVEPDLHLIGPHYIAIINLEIQFQDHIKDC